MLIRQIGLVGVLIFFNSIILCITDIYAAMHDQYGRCVLYHMASCRQNVSVVGFLIDSGADVQYKDPTVSCKVALYFACIMCHLNRMGVLYYTGLLSVVRQILWIA